MRQLSETPVESRRCIIRDVLLLGLAALSEVWVNARLMPII